MDTVRTEASATQKSSTFQVFEVRQYLNFILLEKSKDASLRKQSNHMLRIY
jgi:hypothetical protein